MRRRSHILGAVLAVALAAVGVACSLNPQPYPPGNTFVADDSGADAGAPFGNDGSSGDAGTGADASPPPKEAGSDSGDAGSDATTDAGDGGDADAPTDAAQAEGG